MHSRHNFSHKYKHNIFILYLYYFSSCLYFLFLFFHLLIVVRLSLSLCTVGKSPKKNLNKSNVFNCTISLQTQPAKNYVKRIYPICGDVERARIHYNFAVIYYYLLLLLLPTTTTTTATALYCAVLLLLPINATYCYYSNYYHYLNGVGLLKSVRSERLFQFGATGPSTDAGASSSMMPATNNQMFNFTATAQPMQVNKKKK